MQPAPRQQVDREPGFGDRAAFDPALAADEAHVVPAQRELLRDRDGRIRMAARSPAGEDGEHVVAHDEVRRARAGRLRGRGRRPAAEAICRATFASMPVASIVITSDDPPADRNGSVIPETGSTPTTAPRLIAACPTIQTVIPAASSAPNWSGARRAT